MTEQIDLLFTDAVRGMRGAPAAARRSRAEAEAEPGGPATTPQRGLELFDAQLRQPAPRPRRAWLRARGQGFYTIGSSGHEGNAAVAAALRPTDPALLHYRSGAFFLARARQARRHATALRDVLLGVVAAATSRSPAGGTRSSGSARPRGHPADLDDRLAPAAGGRRGVRARAGAAGSASRAGWPADAVVVCSFGDASANHSTGGRRDQHRGACRVPAAAAAAAVRLRGQRHRHQRADARRAGSRRPTASRPGLEYFAADGCDLAAALDAADARPSLGPADAGARRSCTCARSG